MFVSIFLSIFFLTIVLLECYFIGKYVQLSQDVFLNKRFISVVMGFIIYIFISFWFFLPFYFIPVDNIYYGIIIIIKDFLIITFLISRGSFFKGTRIKKLPFFFILLLAGLVLALYQTVFPLYQDEVKFDFNDSKSVISKFLSGLKVITISSEKTVLIVIIALFSIVFVSSIASMFSLFFKRENKVLYVAIAVLSLSVLFLHNYGLSFRLLTSISLIMFLMISGYNLIIYSRRRYGGIFGVASISIWTLHGDMLFSILLVTISVFVIYTILRKPRASFFTIQLLSPILLILSFLLRDLSKVGAIFTIVAAIVLYASVFVFGRFHFIDQNIFIKRLNYIWPFLILTLIIVWSSVLIGLNPNIMSNVFLKNKELFYIYENPELKRIFNILYYLALPAVLLVFLYTIFSKKKAIEFNLIIYLIFTMFIFGFNPLTQVILEKYGLSSQFDFVKATVIIPLVISTSSFFIYKAFKIKDKKNSYA